MRLRYIPVDMSPNQYAYAYGVQRAPPINSSSMLEMGDWFEPHEYLAREVSVVSALPSVSVL